MINYNTTANTGFETTCVTDTTCAAEETANYNACPTRCRSVLCVGIVLGLLAAFLAFVVGLLIGAAFAEAIMGAMAAIIVLAVVLAVLILVILILKVCLTARRCRCRKDDCC